MARRGSAGAARVGVFVAVGLVGLAGVGAWILSDVRRADREAAAAADIRPELPKGRLQVLSEGSDGWTYLAVDQVRRNGDQAAAPVLTVGRTSTALDGAALKVKRPTVDCPSRRVFDGHVGAFDVRGALLSATPGYMPKHGRPAEPADYEVAALCDGAKGRIVSDVPTAQREAQAPPAELASASADDATAAAWMCASAARGNWRAQAPDDCARAIRLRPADHAIRIDRGYMFIKTGRNGEARADFAKVLAEDLDSAPAIYGLSLLSALAGDEAASRRDRGAALDLDEDVPDWVARTYKIQMSREYRVR
jgi:hypothetical protein